MERDVKKSLEDILKAINEIDTFLEDTGRYFELFQNDIRLQRAVQMNIAIIGEAMNRILKVKPDIKITGARKIVDTRNFVIHGYDSLDNSIIWGIVIRHLPRLKKEICDIIESSEEVR